MAANLNSNVAMRELTSTLTKLDLSKLSRETGFVKRESRKAGPYEFLVGFFSAIFSHQVSLMNLALCIGCYIGDTLSKVAVKKRLNEGFVKLMNCLLAIILADHLRGKQPILENQVFSRFGRVYLQDSVTISLPAMLAQFFPGSGNANGKATATLKIQLIYNALRERFEYFELGSFRDNDQKASPLILKVAKAGDLVIRDLGYFVLDIFERLIEKGIFFLSRLRYDVNIYTADGKKQIDLVRLIKKRQRQANGQPQTLDIDVCIGSNLKVPVRLVAIPLPEEAANKRRREAKKNKDRRLNPDEDHLFLMGYNIFITNVKRDTWTIKEVAEVYELRWRIEIIFKSWKSNFHIHHIPQSNIYHLKAYIYAMLIYIMLIHTYLFIPFYQEFFKKQHKHLSLLKLTASLSLINQLQAYAQYFEILNDPNNIIQQIVYHCAYEKRKQYLSYPQKVAR